MSKVNFNPTEILDTAQQRAGLSDFGDARFQQGLEVLLETMDNYITADEYREKQRETVIGRLVTRLQMQDALRRTPEIREQEIVAPMIVTGLPRSGTSALFNLLNSDPAARGLLLWETICPQPMPGLERGAEDPRFRAIADGIEANRNPEFDKIHYVTADMPEECCLLQVYSFDGVHTGWEYLQEPYHSWFKNHGLDFMYEEHRDHMKLLQWQRPGTRWLLKAPAHMWAVDEIMRVFPDVSLVWGHREPVGVTASICSMTEMVYRMNFGDVSDAELAELGPRVMDWYASSLERGLASREQVPAERVLDYSFTQFVSDPRGVVEAIYQHFNLPMEAATEQAISEHIANNTKGKHGKHEYDLSRYGLTVEQVEARYGFYLGSELLN